MSEKNKFDNDPQWILEKLKRLDARIDSQYTQIHNRYTWFLVTQGFLFTSYALSLSRGSGDEFQALWQVLFLGLPLLACVSAIISIISVQAHRDFLEKKLKLQRENLEKHAATFGIDQTEAPIDSHWHTQGLLSLIYPAFVLCFWLICIAVSIFID